MAAHAAASSYGNLSLNDIFRERKSASTDNHLTKEISTNFWNECRFAVPPGTDVSSTNLNTFVKNLLSHLASHGVLRRLFSIKKKTLLAFLNT